MVTLVLLLVAGVVVFMPPAAIKSGTYDQEVADAAAAIESLNDRDLAGSAKLLSANRGNPDFAYFFASQVTPRSLGDALATVGGGRGDSAFEEGVDAEAYEIALTDLAGVTSLATHGTGDRALPASWTDHFIEATTTPADLYGAVNGDSSEQETLRLHQDTANKQNLLLLLSRGYWSTAFLKEVTAAYWDFDRQEGDAAWPGVVLDDARYAPAANGSFLTDGVLALTAALTANPAASAWAFTEFQPGRQQVHGTDSVIGKFTHYLLFEHQFPEGPDGENVGITATLTALSSAIDATGVVTDVRDLSYGWDVPSDIGPMRDSLVLQDLASDSKDKRDCSWDPRNYWNCATSAAEAVLRWTQRWGHVALDILSLAAFAPPPFSIVGYASAATNATWYAIEGDYVMAGLSLAVVVPALAFGKIAKGVKTTGAAAKGAKVAAQVETEAKRTTELAKRAKSWRPPPWRDCSAVGPGGLSLRHQSGWTKSQRRAADDKAKQIYAAVKAGEAKKTPVVRDATPASERYKATGKDVPDGYDVDHQIELQLGGRDDISNMKPLDKSVNRSFGTQIEWQLRELPYGHVVTAFAIC